MRGTLGSTCGDERASLWTSNWAMLAVQLFVLFPLEDAMRFPYPLRAMRISFELMPFGIWLKPQFVYRRHLAEQAMESGERLWWFRWLWVQVSYSRWN